MNDSTLEKLPSKGQSLSYVQWILNFPGTKSRAGVYHDSRGKPHFTSASNPVVEIVDPTALKKGIESEGICFDWFVKSLERDGLLAFRKTFEADTPLKRIPYQEDHAKIALALEVSLSFVWAMVQSGFPEFGASIEDAQRWLKQNPNFCGSKWVEHPSGAKVRVEYLGGAR